MRKGFNEIKLVFILFSACFSALVHSEDIASFMNKEIIVSGKWAGQSFTLNYGEGDQLLINHKVYGSGVKIVSSTNYPIKFKNQSQVRFSIGGRPDNDFILNIKDDKIVQLFVNGYEIKTDK